MKNVNFFIVALFTFFSSVFSQTQDSKEKWFVRIGAHDINYYPIRSPFKGFFLKRNNSFNPVISSIELEHNIKKHIGLYLDASFGMVNNPRWKVEDNFFIKLSNGINLYVFPHYKLDPYLRLGGGYHKSNNYINRELGISDSKYFKTNKKNFFLLDGGLGLNLWLVSNFGINVQSTYNHVFAKQSRDYLNFWKHNVGLIFRFGNLKIDHDHKIVVENNKEKEKEEKEVEQKICCEDSDNDGILDKEDLCPNQFGLNKFKGCPDTDSDNIPDHEDKCPNQFGLKKFNGCPDTDSDNIPDHEDKCPNQFGKKENKGCPDIVFHPILFDGGKFSLSTRSLIIINRIAKIMINRIPNSKFYINGYADPHGKLYFNKILSFKRARSVFYALVSKGVNPSRIEVRGLGVEKKKGRRVEIIIRK
ncbi:OmpA/MotB Domain-Containing Protein [Blattabacterium sp. (Nauphoeta cinerea)]|uniref:OmpA family protein n=1 Tax=Blattabacterium sp. (Nauphoeta cinerea) TaxID=1316444 RepID=UPI0003B06EC5|nr:OmpA family protein [Blattabacterium sp. (Nauphoeta cinerea)]AGW86154.1 OmpA/MotB Domain-Containing Protein [Blattabacterium sp. (Nauphoeta cinerea)]